MPECSIPETPPSAVRRASQRANSLGRSRSVDDPDLIAARQLHVEVSISEHIRRVATGAPPLSPDAYARVVRTLDEVTA